MNTFIAISKGPNGEDIPALWNGIEGWLSEPDYGSLAHAVSLCKDVPGILVEVGSMVGCSTAMILDADAAHGKMMCFDLFGNLEKWRVNIEPYKKNHVVLPIQGDYNLTLEPELTDPVAFVFIDNSHSLADTIFCHDKIWPLMNTGAVMAFHDYEHPTYPETTEYLGKLEHEIVEKRSGFIAFRK